MDNNNREACITEDLTDKKEHWAEIVSANRSIHGEAEAELKIVLASKIKDYIGRKKNIGIDMAILLVVAETPSLRDTYKQWIISEQKYKGAEAIVDALDSKIIERQSQRKFFAGQDGGTR